MEASFCLHEFESFRGKSKTWSHETLTTAQPVEDETHVQPTLELTHKIVEWVTT